MVVSVVYIVIFSLQQIDQRRNSLINHHYFLPLIFNNTRKLNYKKVKSTQKQPFKGAAKSSSPTQDSQGEKVVKSMWRPRNGCDGRSMAKNFNTNISGKFCADSTG